MKEITKCILIVFLLCFSQFADAQEEWIKIFGDDDQYVVRNIVETYDNGYIISGTSYNGSGLQVSYGIVIKTDINGEVLWEKKIGANPGPGITAGGHIEQTEDGGYIVTGTSYIYDNYGDAYILKLNACGEKEWSRIFYNNGNSEYGVDVQIMDDSSYLTMIKYWGDDIANERIWLFRMSQDGEIIWQKVYAKWTLGTNSEEGRHLLKNHLNEYIITGDYYQYNPGEDTNVRFVRSMFIKIDSLGNEQWHLLWGVDEYFYGWANYSAFDSKGDIYSVGRNLSYDIIGEPPLLMKVGLNGSQHYHKNLIYDAVAGGASTISILEDSILFIGATWQDSDEVIHNGVIKTDTLGNIVQQRDLLNVGSSFNSSIITHDNKYLVAGNFYMGGNWDIYLWKFNKELEYDSIYTQPRVYDSLCPYPIISDTIDLDTTTVNLPELYKQMHRMKVMPNPASSKLYFTLGDLAKGTVIQLYNISGTLVKTINVLPNRKEYEMNISSLPPGFYVAILMDKGRVHERIKVVISR